VSTTAPDALWAAFITTILAVTVLAGGLAVAMVIAQRRLIAQHRAHTQSLLKAQEEERARVAREVHDDAIQRLTVVRHELREFGDLGKALSPEQQHHLTGIGAEVEDLTVSLRRLAHGLHPAVIHQAGLVEALRQLADEVSRTSGLVVDVDLPDDAPSVPTDHALSLFRIAQESLRNVIRHAGVMEASLSMRVTPEGLALRIADHGNGFDAGAKPAGGIGLLGIEERARLAGGKATIHSHPGDGTTVTALVPLATQT
jgi:signal transduction histidine kinase